MCEKCEEQISTARQEMIALLNGEVIPATAADPEGWTEPAIMSLIISRAAVVIQKSDPEHNRLNGAPLSIIIGSVAGVAMEAEMMASGFQEILGDILGNVNPENLN